MTGQRSIHAGDKQMKGVMTHNKLHNDLMTGVVAVKAYNELIHTRVKVSCAVL